MGDGLLRNEIIIYSRWEGGKGWSRVRAIHQKSAAAAAAVVGGQHSPKTTDQIDDKDSDEGDSANDLSSCG